MSPERAFQRNFNRMFHRLSSTPFHVERNLDSCPCGQPCRLGGRYCHDCHAAKQREYRARQAVRRQAESPLAKLARKHMRQA